MKNSNLTPISAILFAIFAQSVQAAPAQTGVYELGKCQIEVKPTDPPHTFEIEVRKDSQVSSLNFDFRVVRANSMSAFSSSDFEMITLKRNTGARFTQYTVKAGGTFSAIDGLVKFEYNHFTGMITAWKSKLAVASYSLPNGLNSGPIKDTLDAFDCSH